MAPLNRGLGSMLLRAAEEQPARTALLDADTCITYEALHSAALKIGGSLAAAGVGPGSRTAILMDRSLAAVMAIHGTVQSGSAYVPLDTAAPASRLLQIMQDCDLDAVLYDAANRRLAEQLGANFSVSECGACLSDSIKFFRFARDGGVTFIDSRAESDLAYILYTSGSTGASKGVAVGRAAAEAFIEWSASEVGLDPSDRIVSLAPLHFDLSIFDIFATVASRASLAIPPASTAAFPQALRSFLTRIEATTIYTVPSTLNLLLDRADPTAANLPTLRNVLFAGEPFQPQRLRQFMERLPGTRFFNLYGPTETNVCTFFKVELENFPARQVPIGTALPYVSLAVLDDSGKIITDRVRGELLVGGLGLMVGYWRDSGATERALLRDETTGMCYYRTGDLIDFDELGRMIFMGRLDHQVKTRGFRVELEDVEHSIRSCPAVTDAVVTAVAHELFTNLLVAHMECDPSAAPEEIVSWCNRHLPKHMIPSEFYTILSLPRTTTGKVDRAAVRRLLPPPPASSRSAGSP